MLKKLASLKNRGLVITIQPELNFSWISDSRQKSDNVMLIMYMKFQKILMTECRDKKTTSKMHPRWVFPHL